MEKPRSGRIRFLLEEEFESLLRGCEDWLKPSVITARYTGLRQGNLLSLQWKQVDLFRKIMTIDQTKNGDRLGMPICDRLLKTLVGLKKIQYLHTDLVFHNADGTPLYKMKVNRGFKKACEKAGIKDFRWYDLRHDFASQLVQRGVDLFRVQNC